MSRCIFKQLPSYTAYKQYVLPPQCAGFHPLLSSLHKSHHGNLVANRAFGGRLFMVKRHLLGREGWLIEFVKIVKIEGKE